MTETFRVMFQTVPPHPSWTAFKHKSFGTLSVAGDCARFVPKTGEPLLIEHVSRVSMGWKESVYGKPMLPLIDTYIEVLYGDRENPSVAYINGNWSGPPFGRTVTVRNWYLATAEPLCAGNSERRRLREPRRPQSARCCGPACHIRASARVQAARYASGRYRPCTSPPS
jgi:hypothetical protein